MSGASVTAPPPLRQQPLLPSMSQGARARIEEESMPKAGNIRVGVGGWTFEPWRGEFYPKGLAHAKELARSSWRGRASWETRTRRRTQSRQKSRATPAGQEIRFNPEIFGSLRHHRPALALATFSARAFVSTGKGSKMPSAVATGEAAQNQKPPLSGVYRTAIEVSKWCNISCSLSPPCRQPQA